MILVTGARGVVGAPLVSALQQANRDFIAVSRAGDKYLGNALQWNLEQPLASVDTSVLKGCAALIHCAPIWLLPAHLDDLTKLGIRRMVVFSSTSVLSKSNSDDPGDQHIVKLLQQAESSLRSSADAGHIELTLLRPSMIYGYGRDQNISHIARRVKRLHFMPIAGAGHGLRQPVHADDLAQLAMRVVDKDLGVNQTYQVAGAERLTYRDMVNRIFEGLGMTPRILSLPLWLVRLLLKAAALRGGADYTASMADRMNQDLTYDNTKAQQELGFFPQGFLLNPQRDLPHD